MKIKYIFLLGRPGCGKSLVYNFFVKHLKKIKKEGFECPRIDDYPVLKELLDADTEFKRHVRKDGGFEVTDFSILNEVLTTIETKSRKLSNENNLVFIEFARGNYSEALSYFSKDMLNESLILYIYCSFDECIKRNSARFRKKNKDNELDDHIVPEDLMNSYYKKDNYEDLFLESPESLINASPAELKIIENDSTPIDILEKNIINIINHNFCNNCN